MMTLALNKWAQAFIRGEKKKKKFTMLSTDIQIEISKLKQANTKTLLTQGNKFKESALKFPYNVKSICIFKQVIMAGTSKQSDPN